MQKILAYVFTLNAMCCTAFAQTISDLHHELQYLAAREMVLSQNLANIDTPNYKPKDLQRNSKSHQSMNMRVTHPGHIQISQRLEYDFVPGKIIEKKPNGNAVTAENELAKKSENGVEFSKTSNVINAVRSMTKVAVKSTN
jgi:flagellar basal-body rod protein FlgB